MKKSLQEIIRRTCGRDTDSAGNAGATALIWGTTTQAEMRGQVFIKTPDMPTDSIFTDQWYLNDINVLPVWKDYTGKGCINDALWRLAA